MKWFLSRSLVVKIVLILVVIGGVVVSVRSVSRGSKAVQYQTATVERGTVVATISASGTVLISNLVTITTGASGVVKNVFIKDGDTVTAGQNIAEIFLDSSGAQQAASAWSSYLSAKNSVDTANTTLWTLQSDMFSKWDTYKKLAESADYDTPEERTLPAFFIANDNWLAAEAKYKQQQSVIAQTNAALSSSWFFYQTRSPMITAPIAGTVTNIGLVTGMVLTSQTGQRVAVIANKAAPLASFTISEIDVPNVTVGQKATITLDSIAGKTFTGVVATVDRIGTTSNTVTTYPVTIKLDTSSDQILPNMAANASIIRETKADILMIPTSAVQMQNGTSTVRVLRNGKEEQVTVQTGISSDTQTEIVSGLSEGDVVITGTTSAAVTTTTRSVFSGFGGPGGMRGR